VSCAGDERSTWAADRAPFGQMGKLKGRPAAPFRFRLRQLLLKNFAADADFAR